MSKSRRAAKKAQFVLEYIALRGFIALFRLVPLDMASDMGGRFWRWLAPRNKRHPRALEHLARAFPEKTPQERERICMAMWDNLGRVMAEGFHLDKIVAEPDRVAFSPEPGVVEALGGSNGAVICSLHSGNWEIAVLPAHWQGLRAAGVYQAIKNPHVDRYVRRLRSPLYPGGLHSKAHSTGRRMLNWVRGGGTLSLLADHRDNRGVVVSFFGHPAPSTPFPALVARSLGVPLVVGASRRLAGARFEVIARLVDVPTSEDKDMDVAVATARIQAVFEEWIREKPEQWMWGHKRWNPDMAIDPRIASIGGEAMHNPGPGELRA